MVTRPSPPEALVRLGIESSYYKGLNKSYRKQAMIRFLAMAPKLVIGAILLAGIVFAAFQVHFFFAIR